MAWVRLHDGAMTHPKIVGLSDKAFRLWVWGLSYSQLHLTDGLIPLAAMPMRLKRATDDLVRAVLWHAIEAFGYRVHDYLDWNDSKELIIKKRGEAKDRMSDARERRSQNVRERTSQNVPESPLCEVLRGVGSSTALSGKEEPDVSARAGALIERYGVWYSTHRHGAKLRLIGNSLEFQDACSLCATWDDPRLEKLAQIVLTTNDDFIAGTDRSFKIFALKASWADDRLRQAESGAPC